MKLQKQLSRKVGTKEYAKWVVTLPPEKIKELGWIEGQELDLNLESGKVIIKKKK